jgi:hypothetical protein
MEPIHHHTEDPGDQTLRGLNRLGLVVALLVAAFAYFLWSHPNYEPVCISGYRSRCGPTAWKSAFPKPPPTDNAAAGGSSATPAWSAPLPRAVEDLPAPPLSHPPHPHP